ncbi:MAG TPA: amino acid permease [Vicinamibacterales bacterium]|nr:amino acid permease [Vicinamibacterales bacterium]
MSLQRGIGLRTATALVVGTIIGSSIFVQASEITSLVPSPAAVVLAWAVAGVLTLIGALVCAELASAYPRTGGVYVYLKEVYSPMLGFLWGWATFWSMHTGILAAIATVFARYAAYFVPLDDTGLRVVAVSAILVLSAINYVGVRFGGGVQSAFTAVKVAAVFAIIVVGWALSGDVTVPPAPPADIAVSNFGLAVAAGLFAFGGWHMVTYTAEETIDPTRTIPRSLLVGIVVVTVCYIGLNAVYLRALPIEKVMTSTRVAADTFEVLVGAGGAGIISALVMFSAFGALNGIVLVGPRIYYQVAHDAPSLRWLNHLHPRYHTPDRAIVIQAIWASVLVLTGSYRALFTRVIYTEWIFFALLALGVVLLRRRPGYTPAWRMPLVPLAPIVFVIASLMIVVNQIRADLTNSAIGLAIVASGLPAYYLWARRTPDEPRASARQALS